MSVDRVTPGAHFRRTADRPRPARRRGMSYVLFLSTGTIVMLIGLSALMGARIQRLAAQGGDDFAEALTCALSAVQYGFSLMSNDPDWRTAVAGAVLPDRALGDCLLSINVALIDDGDGDPSNDPALVTGSGKYGQAVHKMRVTVLPQRGGLVVSPGSWVRITN